MKVSAILKGRTDDQGRKTVFIRINDGAKRKFKTTHIKLRPDQFEKGIVTRHKRAVTLNERIREKIIEAEYTNLQGPEKKYSDVLISSWGEKCRKQWQHIKTKSTNQVYALEVKKFTGWAGDLLLHKITADKLNDYRAYLLHEGYDSNTVWKSFKILRALMRKAKKENVIEYNPFDALSFPKFINKKKEYLTQNEVNNVDAFAIKPEVHPYFKQLANWFLIGCYTSLRFSDWQKFNETEIHDGRLKLYTKKTGELVSLPLKGKIKELFERVEFKPPQRELTKEVLSNQECNESLKKIAKACSIKLNLTAHVARHTFAVRCANAGISPEVTAELMGVTLKTVAIYYKVTGQRIDKEVDKIV
jgi:site-specific recombinase XerD